MILQNPNEIIAQAPKYTRFLGLDVGDKTVGIALSDTTQMIASPVKTIKRIKFTPVAEEIKSIVDENAVSLVIIGLPINMDGTEGTRCQSTRQFAQNLEGFLNTPLYFWDERLSTIAVTRALLAADMSRAKRKTVVDKMAASYILQGFLDYFSTLTTK